MFWYWLLGVFVIILLTLFTGAFMAKKTESVLIGEVWAVFFMILLTGLYFFIGSLLR